MNHDTSLALFVMLVAAVGVALLIACVPVPAGEVCLTYKQARHLWPTRHLWWYNDDGDKCWSNRRGGPPRHLKIEPDEPKPKKMKGDPIFNQIRAEETSIELGAVTWHMARPFDQAQPITPPLNLAVPDDPDVWPDLSDFERRFVGVQP